MSSESRVATTDLEQTLEAALPGASQAVARAQDLVDGFHRRAGEWVDPATGERGAARLDLQLEFAEATSEVDGARTMLGRAAAELREPADATAAQQAGILRDLAFANRLCLRAVDRLLAGAPDLFTDPALQTLAQETRAAVLQQSVRWGEAAMLASGLQWGVELDSERR